MIGRPEVPGPGRAGQGLLGQGWGSAVPQVAGPPPAAPRAPAPLHPALGRELRRPGSGAERGRASQLSPARSGDRRAALRPGTDGARVQVPGAGLGAAVARVARAVPEKHLLATGQP